MIYDYFKEKSRKGIKKSIIIAVILLAVVAVIVAAGSIYMQIIQLEEIGNKAGNYSSVYIKNLLFQILTGAIGFVSVFLVIGITNIFIKRNMNEYAANNGLKKKAWPNLPIAFVLAIIGAFIAKNMLYSKILGFLNYMPFGKTDPIYGFDVGYYIFQRPFILTFYQFMLTLWVVVIIYTAAYYIAMLASYFQNMKLEDLKIKSILTHNLINISILFIIKAFSYKFQREGLLYSSFADLTGAGYVDVNVWTKYFTAAPYILTAIVIIAFIFMWRNKLKQAAISIAFFPAIWLGVLIFASIFQSFVVKPNALHYEKEYIKYNMAWTRDAFNIANVQSKDFPQMHDLTPSIIRRNMDTIDNIRIVDYKATLDSNAQLQSNTNFYNFKDGDIIQYDVNGKETPVFITAREIDKSKLSDQQKTYINTMFKYTHGYGVVVNPINKLTSQGQVDFLLSGLRMDTVDKNNLNVTEPRIYYGEMTEDSVIINPPESTDKEKEIDYDGNRTTSYSGDGGIKLNMLNRLLFAIKNSDLNILISGNIDGNSRLLLNREILKRAQMAVPFLTIDDDPYIVIASDGRLKWIIDAYTSSTDYPYSQQYNDVNYIRNSVKITVDAYNGNVECYIADKNDPIIKSFKKMYPGVFHEGTLPAYVTEHLRYPEELFKTQSEVLKRYHINPNDTKSDNVSMFYTNQDTWNIAQYPGSNLTAEATDTTTTTTVDIPPYYNMIKLPLGMGNTEEMILMRPYTPSGNKHNMVSWLAVRNNADNYGEMILFNFPKNINILGTDQVEVNINQITEISETKTLLGQSGSRVFTGSLLVIPIEDSVLYVEPIYIQSESESAIPQVRKVVVGYQKNNDFKHGVGNTLDEALNDLFKDETGADSGDDTQNGTENGGTGKIDQATIDKIQALLDAAKKNLDSASSKYNELLQLFNRLKNQ